MAAEAALASHEWAVEAAVTALEAADDSMSCGEDLRRYETSYLALHLIECKRAGAHIWQRVQLVCI